VVEQRVRGTTGQALVAVRPDETVAHDVGLHHAGRCNADGCPLDFGSGLSKGRLSEAFGRVAASGLLVEVVRSKGGRPRAGTTSAAGSVWAVAVDKARLNMAPFFPVMGYGQLGRYVKAATRGVLPPPRDAAEDAALREAIACRAARSD
jgi:hypothetical protein